MNIFTKKTPQQLEQEAADAEFQKQVAAASEEGDLSPKPVVEGMVDDDGNAKDPTLLDMTGSVEMGEAPLANLLEVDMAQAELQVTAGITEWPQIEDPRFGNRDPITIGVGCYGNNRLAIEGFVETEYGMEPFATYSVNVGGGLPGGTVAIKNWSEGEGAEDVLLHAGIIEGEPVTFIPSGFVSIPVYKVTARFAAFARKMGATI